MLFNATEGRHPVPFAVYGEQQLASATHSDYERIAGPAERRNILRNPRSRAYPCPGWVKNGPGTLEMGCLYYPRKQTSVGYAADCDVKEVGAQGSGYNNFLNARAATWVDATKHQKLID